MGGGKRIPPVSPPMMEPPTPKKAEAPKAARVSALRSTETPLRPNRSSNSSSARQLSGKVGWCRCVARAVIPVLRVRFNSF